MRPGATVRRGHFVDDGPRSMRRVRRERPVSGQGDLLPGRVLVIEDSEAIRSGSQAGVIMLTARDGLEDRLRGLTTGADDYVVKPFVLAELIARVNALLGRLGRMQSTLVVGDLVVDPAAATVRRGQVLIGLTATEFKLLCHLAEHRGKVLTKTQILSAVWGFDAYDPNLVEVHISALRRKRDQHGPQLPRGSTAKRCRTMTAIAYEPARLLMMYRPQR